MYCMSDYLWMKFRSCNLLTVVAVLCKISLAFAEIEAESTVNYFLKIFIYHCRAVKSARFCEVGITQLETHICIIKLH